MCSLKKILTGLFFVTFFSCILLAPALVLAATDTSRSIKVQLKTDDGEIDDVVTLYGDSYALLIGSSNYYNGWEPLESIPSEISQVESLLKEKGFKVTTLMDPDSNQLSAGFENFINAYGLEKENRLLFFFSGHGFTRNDGKKGYLVPVDAPDPNKDMQGFVRKAIDMSQMMTWAKKIEAKHALFLFDSCFSGTIFKQRSNQKIPKLITRLTILPVRQFITAGSAGEEVPAKSTFTPLFIDALRYGYADLNGDGYIRARELGMYLQNNVPKTADQFPQYGPINDYDLAQGDFIFLTGKKAGTTYTTPETQDRPQDTAQKTYPNSNGILKVQSIPAGAAVYVGNRFQGTTPVTLSDIQPGAHQLRVEKNGYMTQKKQIEVYAGTMTEVEFPLIDTTAGGTLTVETNPNNASIKIADYPGSYTPGMRMPAAYYDLEISKYGYIPESITIELGESEDLHLNVTLKSETSFVRREEPPREIIQETIRPSTITPSNKKIIHTQYRQRGLPPHISNYITSLRSPTPTVVRNTAKTIYKNKTRHPALLKVVEHELLVGYKVNQRDKNHVDAMAWLCNILGSSRQSQYKITLSKVSQANTHKKIKKYAKKNLRYLR